MKRNMKPSLYRIKASAGAGKTYQLALRYIERLKNMFHPCRENLAQIVAITFTNKAASEMKERILGFLKEIALETEKGKAISRETGMDSHTASKWLDVIISNYSDFHVRTIDSLLYAIIKCLSFELGLKPESKVTFDSTSIANEAFDMIIAKSTGSTKHLLEKSLRTFLQMDEQGGFYPEERLKKRLLEDILPKVQVPLRVKEINLNKLQKARTKAEEAYREFYKYTSSLTEKGYLKKNLVQVLKESVNIEKLYDKAVIYKEPTYIFKRAFLNLEKEIQKFANLQKTLRDQVEIYRSLSKEISPYLRIGGYTEILLEVQRLMEEIGQRDGIVLGSNYWTEVVYKEMSNPDSIPLVHVHFGSKFKHFLFDEFQDTSRTQWNALYPLFEEALSSDGSLFVVGDIKQAIYRWRGGDWKLFDEILDSSKYFKTVENPIDKTLTSNYRSRPKLVEFFNSFFKCLTDKDLIKNDISPCLLEKSIPERTKNNFARNVSKAFCKSTQKSRIPEGDSSSCPVKIYRICSASNKEEAKKIMKQAFIEDIKKEWRQLKTSDDKTSIAILVRKNNEAEEISTWLIRENIPVVTENALKLGTSHIVKGIISFMEYIFEPRNLTALYGFLVSGILPSEPLKEEEVANKWIQEGPNSYIEAVAELKKSISPLVNRRSPYELIWEILYKTGLVERLDGNLKAHKVFIERLLEVTHEFQLEEGPSLSRFLDFWYEGGLEERVGLPENIHAVRILTIHKAKGLEFPVVFIPFTDWSTKKDWIEVHRDHLVYLSGPVERLPEELSDLKCKILIEEAQETLNLFYVALTRAEQRLYVYVRPQHGGGQKTLSDCIDLILQKIAEEEIPCQLQNLPSN